MSETTYRVTGMTCGHCAAAVTGKLNGLEGVQEVAVDVPGGEIRVVSTGPLPEESVRAALAETGNYRLAGA